MVNAPQTNKLTIKCDFLTFNHQRLVLVGAALSNPGHLFNSNMPLIFIPGCCSINEMGVLVTFKHVIFPIFYYCYVTNTTLVNVVHDVKQKETDKKDIQKIISFGIRVSKEK